MTVAGAGDVLAVQAVLGAELDAWVKRAAEAEAALAVIAELCDEADAEVETVGWSLGGSVSTGELRAAIGAAVKPS